jgi:hypothetical protein
MSPLVEHSKNVSAARWYVGHAPCKGESFALPTAPTGKTEVNQGLVRGLVVRYTYSVISSDQTKNGLRTMRSKLGPWSVKMDPKREPDQPS